MRSILPNAVITSAVFFTPVAHSFCLVCANRSRRFAEQLAFRHLPYPRTPGREAGQKTLAEVRPSAFSMTGNGREDI